MLSVTRIRFLFTVPSRELHAAVVEYPAMNTIGLFRNATDTRPFAAGATIFREGDEGHEMFVIREGLVEILLHDKVVATLSEGEIFGEMALIDARPRSATARARKTARWCRSTSGGSRS